MDICIQQPLSFVAEDESKTWTPAPEQFLVARQVTEHEKIAGVDWVRRNVVRQPPLTTPSCTMYEMLYVYFVLRTYSAFP